MSEKIIELINDDRFYGPILITIGSLIFYHLVSGILKKAIVKGKNDLERKRRNTLILLFNNIMKYVVIIIAVLLVLDIYKVNTSGVVAGLGIAGVVVGLALQDALKDIIGGINIIFENYYILGDQVRFNDFTGTVIEFGLKSTKIKAGSGEVLILANRSVDKIINLSQKKATLVIEVPTAPSADSEKVQKILENIIEKVKKYKYVDAEGCSYNGIDRISVHTVIYSFAIKCEQEKQYGLKREVLKLVKEAYEKENIKLGLVL